MWGLVVVLSLFVVACGIHREPPAPPRPVASQAMRCTLRISQVGIYVDGEPMSRADAIAYCKRTAGAIVVIETKAPRAEWDATTCTVVMSEDKTTKATMAEWGETRSALEREAVSVYVRGPTGDAVGTRQPIASPPRGPERRGCEQLPPLADPTRLHIVPESSP